MTHRNVSMIKSALRIIGLLVVATALWPYGLAVIVIAELLGIIEETTV